MSRRIPSQVGQHLFSTSTRTRTTLPSVFHSAATPQLTVTAASVPQLGRIGRWYLPTMVLVAIGTLYIPTSLYTPARQPSRRTVTLGEANRNIGYAVSNALGHNNSEATKNVQVTQEERNMMLLNAYGERSSLEDIERALAGLDTSTAKPTGPAERRRALEDAYGERKSLRDVERAMRIYEVQ
ncbi:hypothetical protein BDV95DRAFT_626597 [Massariosphaeria phaeospora]|uniref:Uncharacterized protein n=1 Tax=Massariosphaeria phaeospora TaxID=100035 RepID=A0A7C8IEP6_9PLEO|nr:hypothetical protein BDV95DRAFT_626597 [Massariosphaeria phaeospora]